MRVIDFYVPHLVRQAARSMRVGSDQPVAFVFDDGQEQRSSKPLDHATVLRLVQEAAPPETFVALRRSDEARFSYTSPEGTAVEVAVRIEGPQTWTVAVVLAGASATRGLELTLASVPGRRPAARPDAIALGPELGAPRAAPVAPAPPATPAAVVAPAPRGAPAPVATPAAKASPPAVAPPAAAPSPAAPPARGPAPFMRTQAVETPLVADSIDTLLEGLRARGASDVHIVAERPPLARVAGALRPMGELLSAAEVERLVLPIVPTRLRPDLTANGAVDFSFESPGAGRSRVNLGRQRTGLKAVFRLIPRTTPTIESLGLPPDLRKVMEHHQGLVVITGPTGHGKTTTLAALVDLINSETTHHVITVEDPVEYVHERKRAMMSQREVGSHTRSFHAALKGSLREDPDVIVVGELRDTETVRIALSASETGHLVIGTMNTPSAAKTIDRLIDLFPPGDQPQVRMTLAGGLRLVVSQRLVPRLDGQGMAVAVELLPGMVPLWNLIRDGKTFQIPSLQQRGKGLGIIRLDDSLVDLVKNGVTSLESAREVADSPDEVTAAVERKDAPETPAAPEPTGGARGLFGNVFGGKKG